MKVKDLKPAGYNPRKISKKQLEMLAKSLREFGDLSGVVFNVRTGRLVGGHQRVKELDPSWQIEKQEHVDATGTIAVGHIEAPWGRLSYREVDWEERKEAAANIAANKHGGEWDIPKLKDLIVELDDGSMDMELTGFDAECLQKLFEEPQEEGSAGKAGEVPGLAVPVIIELSHGQFQKWKDCKRKLGISGDTEALLKLMEGVC